jgi:hypothetical protein
MRVMLMATALALTACATGPSIEDAAKLHNTLKHIIQSADDAVVPAYRAAAEEADRAHPDDEVAFQAAMAEFDAAKEALVVAKRIEQGMHLAVDQWAAGADDGRMTKEVAACGAESLKDLGQRLVGVGPWLYAAATALSLQLAQYANGTDCRLDQ